MSLPFRWTLPAPAAAALLLLFPACDDPGTESGIAPPEPSTPGAVRLGVSIAPQADFLRRIAGTGIGESPIEIEVFVGAGRDPHQFSATPRQVMQLGGARAYFTIGMPFEKPLSEKIAATMPSLRIFDMAKGVAEIEVGDGDHDHAGHAHERPESAAHREDDRPEGEGQREAQHHDDHDHGGFDPHVWLSPPLIAVIARNTRDALVELDPANAPRYSENLKIFERELEQLDEQLEFTLEPCRGSAFFIYHPDLTHFAARYGLEQRAIEFQGKSPTPKQLMALVEEARAARVRVIFTQPQFDPASARVVADAIGGTVKSIDPLAQDVLGNLKEIAITLYEAMEKR